MTSLCRLGVHDTSLSRHQRYRGGTAQEGLKAVVNSPRCASFREHQVNTTPKVERLEGDVFQPHRNLLGVELFCDDPNSVGATPKHRRQQPGGERGTKQERHFVPISVEDKETREMATKRRHVIPHTVSEGWRTSGPHDLHLSSDELVALPPALAVGPVGAWYPPLRVGLGDRLGGVDLACNRQHHILVRNSCVAGRRSPPFEEGWRHSPVHLIVRSTRVVPYCRRRKIA